MRVCVRVWVYGCVLVLYNITGRVDGARSSKPGDGMEDPTFVDSQIDGDAEVSVTIQRRVETIAMGWVVKGVQKELCLLLYVLF